MIECVNSLGYHAITQQTVIKGSPIDGNPSIVANFNRFPIAVQYCCSSIARYAMNSEYIDQTSSNMLSYI